MHSGDPGLRLVGAIASTLVELDELPDPAAFRYPYPPLAQRTLNEVVLRCLLDEATPPNSLPGLVKWCHERPLPHWPLPMPEGVFNADSFLLDGESGVLTELCYELALVASTAEPLRRVAEVVDEAALIARMQHDQTSYASLRRLLVESPVLDDQDVSRVWEDGELGQLDAMIKKLYPDAPIRFYDNGVCRSCRACGHLMTPLGGKAWRCERDECRAYGDSTTGKAWTAPPGELFYLDRWHRQFVASPGRTTLALHERLTAFDLGRHKSRLDLWADFGAYDLKITFPGGCSWGLRVADWSNPSLLGLAITSATGSPVADEVSWVVPDHRVAQNPGYRSAVDGLTSGAPRLYTCDEVVDEVRSRLDDIEET